MENITEALDTTDHHCVLNAGGIMLLELEQLDEDMDAQDIAAHDESLLLSPDEALRIAALVEQHRACLEKQAAELDHSFTEVAQAWLDEFRLNAIALAERQVSWWPEIRNEAEHVLNRLLVTDTNPVIAAWYQQLHFNANFPGTQQKTLLTRYFKRLYYQRYPISVEEDAADLEDEE
jgi:hypothetical protein